MDSYKEEHERFVTGHNGTTFSEVLLVTNIPCVSIFLRDAVATIPLCTSAGKQIFPPLSCFIMDFVLLVLPTALSLTVLSEQVPLLMLSILSSNAVNFIYIYSSGVSRSVTKGNMLYKINLTEKKTFVTNFKSVGNVGTVLAILAVDFSFFPRRFAKAETFGIGIMDIGVGGYVVANAIVSPEARGKNTGLSCIVTLRKVLMSTVPLLVIGVARLVSVKGIDYQEHVSEYGVHCNFFFILAALKILSSIVTAIIPVNKLGLCGVVLLVVHQIFLSVAGSDYIIKGYDGKGGRGGGIIDANREGVLSMPGYIAIYLLGVQLGKFIFLRRDNLSQWLWSALHLALVVIVFGISYMAFDNTVQPISRRFVNLAYACCIMSVSCLMLLVCLLSDIAITYLMSTMTGDRVRDETDRKHSKEPCVTQSGNNIAPTSASSGLLEAITFNSLFFFLLANLLTGFVNMIFATIHTPPLKAVSILLVYMVILCLTAVILMQKNISTKIW